MKWFKHYSNARQSNKLTKVMAYGGKTVYADYWLLLELMSEKFDGTDTEFIFDVLTLRASLGYVTTKSLCQSLSCMHDAGVISFNADAKCITIKTDILLLLQGKDFKYEKQKRGQNEPKNKIKNKKKNKIKSSSATGVAPPRVMEIYNTRCQGKLANIKTLSDKRSRSIKVISKYVQTEQDWCNYLDQVMASNFLLGDNPRAWKADFD